jgi:hypothetical protein
MGEDRESQDSVNATDLFFLFVLRSLRTLVTGIQKAQSTLRAVRRLRRSMAYKKCVTVRIALVTALTANARCVIPDSTKRELQNKGDVK